MWLCYVEGCFIIEYSYLSWIPVEVTRDCLLATRVRVEGWLMVSGDSWSRLSCLGLIGVLWTGTRLSKCSSHTGATIWRSYSEPNRKVIVLRKWIAVLAIPVKGAYFLGLSRQCLQHLMWERLIDWDLTVLETKERFFVRTCKKLNYKSLALVKSYGSQWQHSPPRASQGISFLFSILQLFDLDVYKIKDEKPTPLNCQQLQKTSIE